MVRRDNRFGTWSAGAMRWLATNGTIIGIKGEAAMSVVYNASILNGIVKWTVASGCDTLLL